jgi:hypothetical protein
MARALRLALGAAAAAFALAAAPAHAQASEDAVKAAFLPKFIRYVELPAALQPAPGQPYYLCLIGRDPFGALVERAAASESIDGHPVAVRHFAGADAPAIAGCHLAFVAGSGAAQTAAMLAALRRTSALTITDARWGGAQGMIHFVVAGGRVRFHIDDAAASSRGIAISSRLLALAIGVKQRP